MLGRRRGELFVNINTTSEFPIIFIDSHLAIINEPKPQFFWCYQNSFRFKPILQTSSSIVRIRIVVVSSEWSMQLEASSGRNSWPLCPDTIAILFQFYNFIKADIKPLFIAAKSDRSHLMREIYAPSSFHYRDNCAIKMIFDTKPGSIMITLFLGNRLKETFESRQLKINAEKTKK